MMNTEFTDEAWLDAFGKLSMAVLKRPWETLDTPEANVTAIFQLLANTIKEAQRLRDQSDFFYNTLLESATHLSEASETIRRICNQETKPETF